MLMCRGLWKATEDQELYPHPGGVRRTSHALALYHFLGRMLGKALYEVSSPAPGYMMGLGCRINLDFRV